MNITWEVIRLALMVTVISCGLAAVLMLALKWLVDMTNDEYPWLMPAFVALVVFITSVLAIGGK